eukprot:7034909-Prymnesium_polylepis.1
MDDAAQARARQAAREEEEERDRREEKEAREQARRERQTAENAKLQVWFERWQVRARATPCDHTRTCTESGPLLPP